jgi:hypothetical protein
MKHGAPRLFPGRPAVRYLLIAAVLLAMAALVPTPSAEGQATGPFEYIKGDRTTVRAQLQLSLAYGQEALAMLEQATTPDELQATWRVAHKSYALLRFAVHGIELINARTSRYYADPLLELAVDKLTEARYLNIHARLDIEAAAKWADGGRSTVSAALEKLRASIALIQEAADLI